jgi:cell division protein FtsQ
MTKWLLVIGLVVTMLVVVGQWTFRQSYFRVEHVTLIGVHHEPTTAVLDASGLLAHPSMVGLSDASIERRLSSFPWIHSVSLQKHWPNTVVVTVHENVAVAVAFNAAHVLDYVDQYGSSLGRAPLHENLPTLEYLHPASSSWPFGVAGRGAAYVASQLPRAFSSQVSVITDDAQGSVTLQMTTPLTFILGPANNLHAKFVAVASVIAHSTLQPGDVVDVTVPDELAVTPPSNS